MTKLTDGELAELTATKVMGWKKDKTLSGRPCYRNDSEWGSVMADQWNPRNDWNDAGMLIMKLQNEGFWFEVNFVESVCSIYIRKDDGDAWSTVAENIFAPTFPKAATLAALKAAGVECNKKGAKER